MSDNDAGGSERPSCDRCGDELTKSHFGGWAGITLTQSKSFNEWRLCSDCKDDFMDWLTPGGDPFDHGESDDLPEGYEMVSLSPDNDRGGGAE